MSCRMKISIRFELVIISLLKIHTHYHHNFQTEIGLWEQKHNQGFAFNRSTWMKIKTCTKIFCIHDDYNWDWSLQFVSKYCIPEHLRVLQSLGPRIYHLGICGLHSTTEKCDDTTELVRTKLKLEDMKEWLHPQMKYPSAPMPKFYEPIKKNGGFSDLRDITLCMQMSL